MHRDSLISYLYCLGVASQHFSLSILHTVPVLFPVALGIDLDLSWTQFPLPETHIPSLPCSQGHPRLAVLSSKI